MELGSPKGLGSWTQPEQTLGTQKIRLEKKEKGEKNLAQKGIGS